MPDLSFQPTAWPRKDTGQEEAVRLNPRCPPLALACAWHCPSFSPPGGPLLEKPLVDTRIQCLQIGSWGQKEKAVPTSTRGSGEGAHTRCSDCPDQCGC